ncbi:hypothetical protein PT974_04642 [Cladobotryum mycophilum]|uniref:Uncharacterized protein n=1 Tax=Cladobotryum mycophilum TaxID=491253 RepID=A0ABR0SWD5_9HYPO
MNASGTFTVKNNRIEAIFKTNETTHSYYATITTAVEDCAGQATLSFYSTSSLDGTAMFNGRIGPDKLYMGLTRGVEISGTLDRSTSKEVDSFVGQGAWVISGP